MTFLDVGKSRIRYEVHGDGPPLIFAHGVGGNRASWFRQVPHFSETHKVVIFDHRAFGGSSDVEQEGRSRYVDDLEALLDGLGLDRATLVGQSMGGGTCAAFACRHPKRVTGLVVADSLSGVNVPEPLASDLMETAAANRSLSQVERVLGPTIQRDDRESTLLYLQLASFNSVTVKTVRGAMTPWMPEELEASGVPVMFVVGEHDVLFSPAQIEAVAGMVAGARFEVIADAGHSAYFEQPASFNAIVDSFLATIGG